MAAPKNLGGRSRKPKSEVQAEFEKIRGQVEQQKLDMNAKSTEAEKIHETEVKEAVAELTVESIVQKIGVLGGDISKYLSDVSSRLVTGANVLTSLREAVILERKELERLHKIDITKTAIDYLVDEFNQTKSALEKEETEGRLRWTEEQDSREREKKEFEEAQKKQRTREKEEYEYQKAIERKKEEDQYTESQKILDRKNREKQEILEKSWALREQVLKDREEELAKLKKENAEFPEKNKTEIERAVREALTTQELKIQQELKLVQKESESEKRISELRIKSLEEIVARQYAQIEGLSQRLEEAKKQVQDIAVKAIEGASGARALSHVNQIAMEQAKTRGTTPA